MIADRKLAQAEFDKMASPLELDLIAFFKVLEEDVLVSTFDDERTPEDLITDIESIFADQNTGSISVQKASKKYEIGDRKIRADGTTWEKTGTYSWKRVRDDDKSAKPTESYEEKRDREIEEIYDLLKTIPGSSVKELYSSLGFTGSSTLPGMAMDMWDYVDDDLMSLEELKKEIKDSASPKSTVDDKSTDDIGIPMEMLEEVTSTPASRRRIAFLKANPDLARSIESTGTPSWEDKEYVAEPYHSKEFPEKVNTIMRVNSPTQTMKEIIGDPKEVKNVQKMLSKSWTSFYKGKDLRTVTEEETKDIIKDVTDTVNALIEDNPILMRFHVTESVLMDSFLKDGRTKNLFETGRGHGAIDKGVRTRWEKKMLNYNNPDKASGSTDSELKGFESTERPGYAMMGVPKAMSAGKGEQYGKSTLVMKSRVKDRATYHLGNSSGMMGTFTRGGAAKLFNKDRLNSIGRNVVESDHVVNGSAYFETQIWGGVNLADDVEYINIAGSEWSKLTNEQKSKWKAISEKYSVDLKMRDGTVIHAAGSGAKKVPEDAKETTSTDDHLPSWTKSKDIPIGGKVKTKDGYKVKTSKFTYTHYDTAGKKIPTPTKKSTPILGDRKLRKDGVYEKTSATGWSKIKDIKYMSKDEIDGYSS